MAQLYYPRLLCASNGFGRIHVSYRKVVALAFPRWDSGSIPPEPELMSYMKEYAENRLIFLYQSNDQIWGQWDAKKSTFGKYQTTEDKRSPAPPAEEFGRWQDENRQHSTKTSVTMVHFELLSPSAEFPQGSEKLRHGSEKVGDGIGIGVGKRYEVLGVGIKPSAHSVRRAKNQSGQVSDATGETKHKRIEHMLQSAWEEHNPGAGKCPWGADDGAQLKRTLAKTTNWPDSSYAQCISNLYATEGFPRSELPVFFLPRLPTYFQRPRDRYNRELGASNGNGTRQTSKANDREQRVIDRARRFSGADATGEADSAGADPVATSGNGGYGISGLAREPEIISPGKDSGSTRPPDDRAAKATAG